MTEAVTETPTSPPKTLADLQVKPERIRRTCVVEGVEVQMDVVPASRYMIDQALEKSVFAYMQQTGKSDGFIPSIFRLELARSIIKWWNLPTHVTNGGWESLTIEAANEIAKASGIDDAQERLKGTAAKEVTKAKN